MRRAGVGLAVLLAGCATPTSVDHDTDVPADTDLAPDTDRMPDTDTDTDTDADADTDTDTDTGFEYPHTGTWRLDRPCYPGDTGEPETAIGWPDTGLSARTRVDGSVADWSPKERLRTSTDARGVFSLLGWSRRRLVVGLRHPDLAAGRADLDLVLYLGTSGSGAHEGLPGAARTPALAQSAVWAVRWRTDGSLLELWHWWGGGWRPRTVPARLEVVRALDAPAVEVAVPFMVIGCGDQTATWMLVDRAASGLTTAASPEAAVVEGPDADVACAFTFDPTRANAFTQLVGDCGQVRRRPAWGDTATP